MPYIPSSPFNVGPRPYLRCPTCDERDAEGLCNFPRVYYLCNKPTCGKCGSITGNGNDRVRCAEHKDVEPTEADIYDLGLYDYVSCGQGRRRRQETGNDDTPDA